MQKWKSSWRNKRDGDGMADLKRLEVLKPNIKLN